MRRSFNRSERTALFLAAGGRCTTCKTDLQPGWHADHIHPYSRGGATDVINGQALCPRCNLNKGDKTVSTREWQTVAMQGFLQSSGENYLVSAAPGSGKTRFALAAAKKLKDAGMIDRLIVVCPSAHLRKQWADSAHAHAGLHIDPYFKNDDGMFARDYDGVAITYHSVAKAPSIYRRMTGQARTLVVFDEIHHAGESDNLSWGSALTEAFSPAYRRLLLSGTPFRSDYNPIPFVRYVEDSDGKLRSKADYSYDYGEALTHGVVRSITFNAKDAQSKWQDAGVIIEGRLDNKDAYQWKKALRTALTPDGNWIPSVLRDANDELTNTRTLYPNAGGLVIAEDQNKARQYAKMLEQISGSNVVVAISDDKGASDAINAFRESSDRWLVAVKMVSEGVDIPRLTVGVYATNTVAPLFFTQVVGRFVRRATGDDDVVASLYIPSVPPLLELASEIERARDHVLEEQSAGTGEQRESRDTDTLPLDLFVPLDSSERINHSTIHSSVSYSPDEIARAERLIADIGAGPNYRPEVIAKMLRAASIGSPVSESPEVVAVDATSVMEPKLADQKKALKQRISRLVGKLARRTGGDYSHIHSSLNSSVGERSIQQATVPTLEKRITLLTEWLALQ